jgi:hypothetical protein
VYDPAPAFSFDSTVAAAEQQELRDDVAFALAQLRSLTGAPLRGPTIYVSRNSGQLAEWFRARFRLGASAVPVKKQQYDSGGVTAEAGENAVFVVASSRSWEFADAANRQKILAHELFHLVQQQLMNKPDNWGTTPSTQIRPSGPVWLTEGAAETIAYRVAAARGLFDLGQVYGSLVAQAPSWTTPLNGFETYAGSGAVGTSWNTMWFAASRLLDTTPKGLGAAVDYWQAIAAGTPWPEAFQKAFGRSVDQFYAEFAAYRATL